MTRFPSLLLMGLFLLASCSSDDPVSGSGDGSDLDISERLRLVITSGGGQVALQSDELPTPVSVRVTTQSGDPVQGIRVRAQADDPRAQVTPEFVETDADGNASFTWTLGLEYTQSLELEAMERLGNVATTSAVATYRYFAPSATNDGWPVDPLDPAAAGAQRLFEGVDHIRRGAFSGIHSLVVVQGGDLVFETYFEGEDSQGRFFQWTRDTPHEQQSASKSFRSALIGLAIDRGYMTVDTRVVDLFPDYAQHFTNGKEAITVGDFLTMSSGLEWDESGAAAGQTNNNLSQMYSQPQSTWTGYVFSRPLAFTPGSRFVYNTGASILLDDMVVRASGMTLREFVYSYYFNPIQSAETPGFAPESGITKTPREMAKLGQIYLDDGLWKQTRILSESWIEESFAERMNPWDDVGYGYQWWMQTLITDQATYRVRYASGNGGQFIMIVDELDLVIVSTGGNFGSSLMNQFFTIAQSYVLPAFE